MAAIEITQASYREMAAPVTPGRFAQCSIKDHENATARAQQPTARQSTRDSGSPVDRTGGRIKLWPTARFAVFQPLTE
jgi:hypothetical protein